MSYVPLRASTCQIERDVWMLRRLVNVHTQDKWQRKWSYKEIFTIRYTCSVAIEAMVTVVHELWGERTVVMILGFKLSRTKIDPREFGHLAVRSIYTIS